MGGERFLEDLGGKFLAPAGGWALFREKLEKSNEKSKIIVHLFSSDLYPSNLITPFFDKMCFYLTTVLY